MTNMLAPRVVNEPRVPRPAVPVTPMTQRDPAYEHDAVHVQSLACSTAIGPEEERAPEPPPPTLRSVYAAPATSAAHETPEANEANEAHDPRVCCCPTHALCAAEALLAGLCAFGT